MINKSLSGFIVDTVMFSRSGSNKSFGLNQFDRELPNLGTVILALPLDFQGRKLLGAERLWLMKDGALSISVARSPIIDTVALVAELNSGRIQPALDMTDLDPYPVALHSGHPGGPTQWVC